MVVTMEERISWMFWWAVAFGITAYLCLGIVDTFMVILH